MNMRGVDATKLVLDRVATTTKSDWVARSNLTINPLAKYLGNPILFCEEFLGDTLTIEQKEILTRIAIGGETNVMAAHGVGKSFIGSRIVLYNTIVVQTETITTAPTFRQVSNVLWKEVRKIHSSVKSKVNATGGRVFIRSGTGSAFGFTAQHNSTDAFQGVHAAGLTVIIDEACGISNEIDDGATACAVDAAGGILRIGNPTNPNTPFAKACKLNGAIRIPVWGHPNVSWAYEGKMLREWVAIAIGLSEGKCFKRSQWAGKLRNLKDPVPGAVSIEWIEKVRHKFGIDSAYWQSRVNAYFPDNASDGMIPYSWLIEARARYDRDPEYWDNLARDYWWNLGLDVADGGGDRHALSAWRGRSVLYSIEQFVPKGDRQDTMRIVGEAIIRLKNYGEAQIAVDNLGVGAGTLGRLREQGYFANACTFSESPTESPDDGIGYRNLRTQIYWQLRERLQAGEIAIAPLGEEIEAQLFEELSAMRYDVNSTGIICAEAKKEIKKRLGKSPDLADAVAIGSSLSNIDRAVAEVEDLRQPWEKVVEVDEFDRLKQQLGV